MQNIPTRPGKRLQFANLKMAIEIVDLPSYKMVDLSIVNCKRLPEGICEPWCWYVRKLGDFGQPGSSVGSEIFQYHGLR
jgi:hypothetical protein